MSSPVLAPGPIPVPPDFPVSFGAGDEARLWQRDAMHFPSPQTPLDAEMAVGFHAGASVALAGYEMPVTDLLIRVWNGYVYNAPNFMPGTPEELEAQGERAQARLQAAMHGMLARWREETLPEVLEVLAWWDRFDLAGCSDAELAAHVGDTWEALRRLSELHFRTVFPMGIAMSEFDELCRELFPGSTQLDAMTMLGGLPNLTLESGQELWRLSRRALELPAAQEVLETRAAGEVVAALEASEEGRDFLGDLRAYLARYGQRNDMWGLSGASWIEDPSPAIKTLKDFITRPDSEAPAMMSERAAEEREAAIAAAREQLAGYPAAVRERFEGMLVAGQEAAVVSEDHNFYIDFAGAYRIRRVMIEAGRRLVAAGVLGRADDVMLLRSVEIRALLDGSGDPAAAREAAVQRAADLERQRALRWPPVLGTMPPGPPPDNPMMRFMGKFFGQPPAPSESPDELRGAPGSAGCVRGPARVVRSLSEADALRPGEVLVAETTAPPWTPLFATAAAVVTDTGGALSHCAVVAREYGIPAVVGTAMATAVIEDGMELEVDGSAGVVRLV